MRLRAWLSSRGMEDAVRIAVVASLGLSLAVALQQQQLVGCLVEYNDGVAKVNDARVGAGEEDRRELDRMLTTWLNARERGAALKALQDYVRARERADRVRAENPLPAPPSELCS